MTASTESQERRAYRVIGDVQGVGFRWWTRRTASELGIAGTVRNASDGSVEVVARGPASALTRFREALGRGPPAAEVRRVEAIDHHDTVDHDGFDIIP